MPVDKITKRWIFNAADEHAAEKLGMRVDEERIDHLFHCLSDHIVLWEGESAGKPWAPLSWHWETLGSVFGWVRYSEHFNRWIRRFRIASIWIGKKNGKSPTGAAVGLYLTRFDGEMGQQVYSAARDGKQAMIVHGNAMNMVRNSPTLTEDLKINKATGRIYWEAGDSVYAPMSSDNVRSQEGLNGSVIIDEAHTVDDRLGRIIADMGASRAEPICFEISTGGEGIDNYGRKHWEHGLDVIDGRVKDPYFYFKAYSPPQNTPDDDLAKINKTTGLPTAKTLKLWKQANPSLGEILSVEEMTQSCVRARRTEADWAGWKARRLNIWQRASAPWLGSKVWDKANDPTITYEACKGCGGGMGLDLARVNDMTAAVVVCPSPEFEAVYHVFSRFWLPEERLRRLAAMHVPDVLDWHKDGWLATTDGKVTDFTAVREGITEMIEHFDVSVLCFDRLFASELSQDVSEESGILAADFPQTFQMYSTPCSDFKRMLLSGQLVHDGNPVLGWQAGHCLVRDLGDGRMKPQKEKGSSWKTIDGVQAAIMGLYACQLAPLGEADDVDII